MPKVPLSSIPLGEASPAAATEISLAQAILGTLDAVYTAQVHGARSFLNFLLQLGYAEAKDLKPGEEPAPYTIPFTYETSDDARKTVKRRIEVPTLALVPVTPISIESADIKLAFRVESLAKFQQSRESVRSKDKSEEYKRPWFLVPDPISLRGTIGPQPAEESTSSAATIEVALKLARVPAPEALQRLLSALGNTGPGTVLPESPPPGPGTVGPAETPSSPTGTTSPPPAS